MFDMFKPQSNALANRLRKLFSRVLPYLAIFVVTFGITRLGNMRMSVLPTGDEIHVLIASWSLAKDGDFDLKNQYDSDFLFAGIPDRAIVAYGDKQYLVFSLGESILYWLPAKLAVVTSGKPTTFFAYVKLQMNLLWVLAAVLLFYSLNKITSNRIISSLCAIGLVALFPGILYASSAQADSMGGVLFTYCLAASLSLNPRRLSLGIILGLLAGLLLWVHPRFALIALVIGLVFFGYSIWVGTVRKAAIAFLLPFTALMGILVMVNSTVYPAPSFWMSLFGAYPYFAKIASLRIGFSSLPHTLFDGWHGLIPVFPLSIASVIGLVMNREKRLVSIAVVLLLMAYLVISGSNPDALGNGLYLGGRYHIVFLGCLWWGLGLYLSQLKRQWNADKLAAGSGKLISMPLLALGLMFAVSLVSTYYAYRTDAFTAQGTSYGSWSSLFPTYFTNPSSHNHLKALYLCVLSMMFGLMLLRAGRTAYVAGVVVCLSLLMYIVVAHSGIQRERAKFREVVDFKKHVVMTESNAGKYSPDFYVKLDGEGDYTVKYYVKAGNIDVVSRGSHIGFCDAVHYLGSFSKVSVYPGIEMIAGNSINEGQNVLTFRFHYEGAGPVFLRCYVGVPGVSVEMQEAVVEFTR